MNGLKKIAEKSIEILNYGLFKMNFIREDIMKGMYRVTIQGKTKSGPDGEKKRFVYEIESTDGLAAKNHAISELRRMYPAFKIKRIGGIMVEQL